MSQIIDFCICLFVSLLLLFLSAVINFCEFEFQSLMLSTVFGVERHRICTNVDLKRLMKNMLNFIMIFLFSPESTVGKL